MHRFVVVFAVSVTLFVTGCQETKEELQNPLSEKDIYKTIGEEIPFETGMEWIEYYRKKIFEQGRTETSASYQISATQMNTILQSADELVGVAFHYGIDEAGETHVLVIPVDEQLSLWSSIAGRVFADANTGDAISQEVASAWALQFKNSHPDEKWFHFFGKDIFDEMRAIPYFTKVEIEPAINTLDLTPQLLLVVPNEEAVSSGRATADSDGVVYDASNACPPCAVE